MSESTSRFANFRYRTTNLGDDTQSYAIALHLPRIDAWIDRDAMADLQLDGPHRYVTNSWFFLGNDARLPAPQLEPVFHGISLGREELLTAPWVDYFQKFGPVGCRDLRSAERLQAAGVDAFWSGCLTLFIGRHYAPVPQDARKGIYFIDVAEEIAEQTIPKPIRDRAIRLGNEIDPLIVHRTGHRFAAVHRMMHRLAHAELVVTRRLHIALPCVGFGTPVLALPNARISDARLRFSGFDSFVPTDWRQDRIADFDFDSPCAVQIPPEILAAHARLAARLDSPLTARDWGVQRQTRTIDHDGAAPRHATFRLGIDEEACPVIDATDSTATVLMPPYPFVEKLAGTLIPVVREDGSVARRLEDYAFRSAIDRIAGALAFGRPVSALDAEIRDLARGPLFDDVFGLWAPALRQARLPLQEAAWRRLAVDLATDAYETARLVETIWRGGDTESARAAAGELRATLESQSFVRHGDLFHREMNRRIIDNLEAVFDYEAGRMEADDARLADIHPFVTAAIYEVMWLAQAGLQRVRARRLALLYITLVAKLGYGAETTLWVVHYFLTACHFHADALQVLTAIPADGLNDLARLRLQAGIAVSALELGRLDTVDQALEMAPATLSPGAIQSGILDAAWQDAVVMLFDVAGKRDIAKPNIFQALNGIDAFLERLAPHRHHPAADALAARLRILRGVQLTAAGKIDEALESFGAAAVLKPSGIDQNGLQGVDLLARNGRWQEAAQLYAGSVLSMWAPLAPLMEEPPENRLARKDPLPDEGRVLSGWGIGDDILRLSMLGRLKGRQRPYGYDLDARLVGPASNAGSAMRFDSVPRIAADQAASCAAFWRARDGVPVGFDAFRLTSSRFEALRRGARTMLSEDIILAYLRSEGRFPHPFEPVFAPSAGAIDAVKARLSALPGARATICICWRSSLRGTDRDRFFFEIEALRGLFELPGINWIVTQPDLEPRERDWLGAHAPAAHIWDDFDYWNDFDGQAALFTLVDLLIAPKLSMRDFAAACGGKVLSLSVGYHGIEGARIAEDGVTDRIFPDLTHLCGSSTRSRADVVQAACRAVEALRDRRAGPGDRLRRWLGGLFSARKRQPPGVRP